MSKANTRQFIAAILGLLLVAVVASVAAGDFLFAPVKGMGAGTMDTIAEGSRLALRPVEIQFPAKGLSAAERELFAGHLAEQEMTLNRLSLTAKTDLEMHLLNYPNIKSEVAASRALARGYLEGSGAGLDAAHALDAVAGGYMHEFAGFRSPIQQYIGSLWRTRAGQIVPGRVHRLVPIFGD